MNRPNIIPVQLGQVVATPGAVDALVDAGIEASTLLRRHQSGDWGDLCEDDARLNDQALSNGSRLFSSYKLANQTSIWIITEAQDDEGRRSVTSLLLPSEY